MVFYDPLLTSIVSLLLLILPGYAIFSIGEIDKRASFNVVDKFIFGFIIWMFYLVATILLAKILAPTYANYVFWLNYVLGGILLGYLLLKGLVGLRRKLSAKLTITLRVNLTKLTLEGALPFILLLSLFIGIITLYTPLIFQYDALSLYLTVAKQLVGEVVSPTNTYPTFGDVMPVMPILYAWFYHLSEQPILRLLPLTIFFLLMLLVYRLGRTLFPEARSIAYMSMVSYVSMNILHIYMAKTSLYLDLGLIFLIASSFYIMLQILEKNSPVIYLILGVSLSLLILVKEFGVFYAWLIIVILLFLRFREDFKRPLLVSLTFGVTLLAPFITFHIVSVILFPFYNLANPPSIFRLSLYLPFFTLLTFSTSKSKIRGLRLSLLGLALTFATFSIPIIFFAHNLISLGVPIGSTFKEFYIMELKELGVKWPLNTPNDVSPLRIFDLFLTNMLMAPNLFLILLFLSTFFLQQYRGSNSFSYSLLSLWFFYTLFSCYYFSFGQFEGGFFRRFMPLIVPVTLIVAIGAYCLFSFKSWPNWLITTIYTAITSIVLSYFWLVKFNLSKWWLENLQSLTNITWSWLPQFAKATPLELLLYALPWLLIPLIFRFKDTRKFSKKVVYLVWIILILISSICPAVMLNYTIRCTPDWNPAYYDKAESVKVYQYHWYMPVIEFYNSKLKDDNAVTLVFGAGPLRYFLKHPFIELLHPRNLLIYPFIIQSDSEEEIIKKLEEFNIKYFLIPRENHFGRSRYEAILEESTLFKLVVNSAVIAKNDGQKFKFEKLRLLGPFDLYTIKPPS